MYFAMADGMGLDDVRTRADESPLAGHERRNKKQTAVINIRKYKRVSGKKKGFILTFRMFQHTSSEVVNR